MKTYRQPSGLTIGLDFLIDSDWTPDQALAVVELLDDLKDRILLHYQLPIMELMREESVVSTHWMTWTTQTSDARTSSHFDAYVVNKKGANHGPFFIDQNIRSCSVVYVRQFCAFFHRR